MANDKNLRSGTSLFPLEALKHQTGWPQSLLAELCGVSISQMSRVFAGTRTLSVEAVAKLRRFFIAPLKKNDKLYLANPQNLPFKNEYAQHYLQRMLLQLQAEQADVELKLDAMKAPINAASESVFHMDNQLRYIKAHKLATKSELISLEYYQALARVRSGSDRVRKVFQLEVRREGLKAEISHVVSMLNEMGTDKKSKK